MTTKPKNLHEAVRQAIGHASVCWVGGTGDRVFDSTQAAIVGADLIEWIEEWHRSEQPSYLPSGMDEFASNERTDHLPLIAPPGWNQVEETVDEYWAAMAKRDPAGPQPPPDLAEGRTLAQDLASVINRHNAEKGSETPDFILAEALVTMLAVMDQTINDRGRWYGHMCSIGDCDHGDGLAR